MKFIRLPPTHPQTQTIIFYDGSCGMCHQMVTFVLKHDQRQQYFLFAPIGGVAFKQKISPTTAAHLPDSIVVFTEGQNLLTESAALEYILKDLGGFWRLLGILLGVVPRMISNPAYRWIAKWRHRIAATPDAPCPVVPAELRNHFLD